MTSGINSCINDTPLGPKSFQYIVVVVAREKGKVTTIIKWKKNGITSENIYHTTTIVWSEVFVWIGFKNKNEKNIFLAILTSTQYLAVAHVFFHLL